MYLKYYLKYMYFKILPITGYRRQTDDRRAGDSEHECEFTFAKNQLLSISILFYSF